MESVFPEPVAAGPCATRQRNLRLSHLLYGYHDYNPISSPPLSPVSPADTARGYLPSCRTAEPEPEPAFMVVAREDLARNPARNIALNNFLHGYHSYPGLDPEKISLHANEKTPQEIPVSIDLDHKVAPEGPPKSPFTISSLRAIFFTTYPSHVHSDKSLIDDKNAENTEVAGSNKDETSALTALCSEGPL